MAQHAYPDCGCTTSARDEMYPPHNGTAICIHVKLFTRGFRALAIIGGPVLLSAIMLLVAVYCARRSDRKHLERFHHRSKTIQSCFYMQF